MLLATETSVRTLHAYVGIFQSRLALARTTGTRQEFEGVSDRELAHVAVLCSHATDSIDAVLERLGPGLASHAAAIADLTCQREFELPRPPVASHLRLVAVEADRPA